MTIGAHARARSRDQVQPLLAILFLGVFSQIAQAVLIREALVVFYGNEASLGAFYGSWLLWLAAGSSAALRWGPRLKGNGESAMRAVRALLLALPAVLVGQVLLLRTVRLALDVSAGQLVPLGELLVALTLVTLPVGVLLGLAFPLVARALESAEGSGVPNGATGPVARTYAADALGALLGGVLFTFVLIRWLGTVQTLGLTILTLALAAAWLPAWPGPRQSRRWLLSRAMPWALALTGLILALPQVAGPLDRALEALRFATLQPGMTLLDAGDTPYGHVAVARLGGQTSIVADGQIRESFPLPREVETRAAYVYAQAPGARRALILGGYPGGLAAGLLRYPLERIDQVEQDRAAFERVRPYLDGQDREALGDARLQLHFGDARRFLRRLAPDDRYDLILSLDATPASAAGNRLFTREAFALARGRLAPGGVFCTRVGAASNYLGRVVEGYAGSVYRTLGSVFESVALVPGGVQIFCASDDPGRLSEDPAELMRRYLAAPLADHGLPPGAFATLLPTDEVAFVRRALQEAQAQGRLPLNTDARPVTFYLNMLLWGQESASGFVDWLGRLQRLGPWPYLVPALLALALGLVRLAQGGLAPATARQGAGLFALLILGAIAMAGELVLLLGFQTQAGLVFERVALLGGLFMTGLALGGGLAQPAAAGRRAGLALGLILGALGLGLLWLPTAIGWLGDLPEGSQQAGFLGLSLALGFLSGAGFTLCLGPIGGALAGSALERGGLALAADNLGGALGGLVAGALMVPILGVAGTSRVLAALALAALLGLGLAGLARRLPAGLGAAGARARPSFPWPGLGWGLIYAVLLVYAWHLLALGARPGPEVRFEPDRLAQVAGPDRFELSEAPFVHYLGFAPGEQAPGSVALASAAALAGSGAEPGGFAGPVRLLLALGRDGVLRGVRYLDSRETPSYIAGIDDWLAGLAGRDLSRGPLATAGLDGLSGATVTSRAVLATVDAAARRATETAFGHAIPPLPGVGEGRGTNWGLWATAALLVLFFPVYLSGSERWRLAFQVASLAVLGVWLNTLLTELDLVHLSQGQAASPAESPQRWLLLGFAGLSTLLFGQVWCGYLCPFGALQELISRLGRRLKLRVYPDRPLEQRMRYLKFVLLAAMLILVWTTGQDIWATFDPMQQVFAGRIWARPWGLMTALALLALGASLVHYRFWCRYFCPLGAFLALGNKLALAQRLAPRRRFERCDLGVKGEHDLDCIRCNRCLAGRDTHARPGRSSGAQRPSNL